MNRFSSQCLLLGLSGEGCGGKRGCGEKGKLREVHDEVSFLLPAGLSCWCCFVGSKILWTPCGPDLTQLASRDTIASGSFQNTPENLRKWIDDSSSMKPGLLMPSMHLKSHDLDVITQLH